MSNIEKVQNPLISIITVVYNREQYIGETILSVLEQSYTNIEYIIIDGGSIDKTVDIISKYMNRISYFVSEKDEGMYEAINKGLKKATGDYIMILNSDDSLCDKCSIENVVSHIDKKYDVFYGRVVYNYKEKYYPMKSFLINKKSCLLLRGSIIPHPALFVSAKTLEKVNGYNLEYKYGSDYDYILNLFEAGYKFSYINVLVTKFRIHPNSITSSGKLEVDRKFILEKHGLYNYNKFERCLYRNFLLVYYRGINFYSYFKMYLRKKTYKL